MLLLIAGGAAVAVTSSSAHLPSLFVYLGCSIIPAAARLFSEGQPIQHAMGVFALVYTAVLVGVGVSNNRLETRTVRLTLENSGLIADLESSNQELNLRVAERTAELQQMLEVVRRSRSQLSRFHALLDHSGVGVFVADPETLVIVDCNQAAGQLLQQDSKQIQGQSLPSLELSPGLARTETWKDLLASRANQSVALDQRSDGSFLELSVAYQEFEGSPYAVLVLRDATDRRQMEAQLRRSQKMEALGKLAGGIAHDFNNILTAVIGLANMIALETAEGSSSHSDALSIIDAGERASTLTKKLLALTRSGLEKTVVLEINEAVRDLFKMLRRTFSQDIELVSLLSEAACPVRMAPGELDQILLNLAFNARDAMPSGGVLTVEVALAGDAVMIEFSDTGTGMAANVREKIFDPFFTTKGQMGHGLGLSTCFGLVTRAGGQISVTSEVGKGAKFRILLPLDSSERVTVPVRAETANADTGSATILVVEDHEAVPKKGKNATNSRARPTGLAAVGQTVFSRGATEKGARDVSLTLTPWDPRSPAENPVFGGFLAKRSC